MKDWKDADRRLVDWLKDRTDVELQRLLDAPDDGLTNSNIAIMPRPDGGECACLTGWATGDRMLAEARYEAIPKPARGEATEILFEYGVDTWKKRNGTVFRHIKAFVAAELLTRRVDRKALPAPREAAHA